MRYLSTFRLWESENQIPLTLYHSTLIDRAQQITQEGFRPGKVTPSGQDWLGKHSGSGTYFHQRFPSHALLNSWDPESGEVWECVIEVHGSWPLDSLRPDEETWTEDPYEVIKNKDSIVVLGHIPPEKIQRIHLIDTPISRALTEDFSGVPIQFHPPKSL
jgi:hypothetical protein